MPSLILSRIEKTLVLGFFALLSAVAISQVHSFDIFWQLQSGKYMVETSSFIYHDIFTLAADAPRHEHCWLHDLVFYIVYLLGGYKGISIIKGILIVSTAAALWTAARLRGASRLAVLFLLPPAVFLADGWLERPQLWTFLFFALFILLLECHRRRQDRWIYLLPVFMLAWANLHAGAILAFALLLAYLAGEGAGLVLRRSDLDKRGFGHLCLSALGVVAASTLTPYLPQFFRTLLGSPQFGAQVVSTEGGGSEIVGPMAAVFNMDWRPTTLAGDPLFFAAVGVTGLVLLAGWRRFSLTDFFLLAGLFLMGMKLSRHISFFFLGSAAILPVYLDSGLRPIAQRLGGRLRGGLHVAGLLFAAASIVWFWLPQYQRHGLFATGLREWHYPIRATNFVIENRLPANLYNTYDWGGYLAWQLYPDYQVFWDGRQDSPEMFRQGWLVMAGKTGWDLILERFDIRTIVTRSATIDTGQRYPLLDLLQKSQDWEMVFADDISMVFVRGDAVDAEWLASHRLEKSQIEATVLTTAKLMTSVDPRRYMAWWEIGRIYWQRKEYPQAFAALEKHLSYAPEGRHLPEAERYFRILYPMYNK